MTLGSPKSNYITELVDVDLRKNDSEEGWRGGGPEGLSRVANPEDTTMQLWRCVQIDVTGFMTDQLHPMLGKVRPVCISHLCSTSVEVGEKNTRLSVGSA